MKRRKTLLAISAMSLALQGCQSTSQPLNNVEHPSYGVYQIEQDSANRFAQQTAQLSQALVQYCRDQSVGRDGLTTAWQQSMVSWMALQGQERGPAAALEQSWNVQFWPDKKNTTGRKMAALLAQNKAWTTQEIATQSVTVQGLGAIEWLLYDQGSNLDSHPQTCQLGVAIAQHLHGNAEIIAQAWQNNPWQTLKVKEWHSEYISLLSNQLDYAMKKLSRPLGSIGQPRPYFSESWRSQTSLLNLKANVAALRSLYLAQGHGLDATLRQMGKQTLADRVLNQFDVLLATWPEQPSLVDVLQSKEGYRVALAQLRKLEQLNYLIHDEVAVELGIVIGFNATDGD